MDDRTLVELIANEVSRRSGRALFVGGYARDSVLRQLGHDIISKDIDIEMYGIGIEELKELLSQFGSIDVVGASFGVIKLHGTNLDISIPRRDSKVGVGHKGFIVDADPLMSTFDAAKRRDFTINTIAIDVLTGEVIDEHGGVSDLTNKILRVTDADLFVDDPLRVFRAVQLASRFELQLTQSTVQLCRSIDLSALSQERIGEEWRKLLLLSHKPSIGLEVAKNIQLLEKLYPEFDVLDTIEQDPRWHPEGHVWEHTKITVDAASKIARRDKLSQSQSLELLLASLCHDIGKSSTTVISPEGVTSYGHEKPGAELAEQFIMKLALPHQYLKSVPKLVDNHMFFVLNRTPSDTALRRLAQRVYPGSIDQLLRLAEADTLGIAVDTAQAHDFAAIRSRADHLVVNFNKAEPIVLGRDLLALGVQGGPGMGKLLDELYEMQLQGLFTDKDGGIEYATNLVDR